MLGQIVRSISRRCSQGNFHHSLPRQSCPCQSTLLCDWFRAGRRAGALVVLVEVHLFELGSYLPPVLRMMFSLLPPQMIISPPVQIAVWLTRPPGALITLVAAQVLLLGLYLPPVFTRLIPSPPPQMIISMPVHTAV